MQLVPAAASRGHYRVNGRGRLCRQPSLTLGGAISLDEGQASSDDPGTQGPGAIELGVTFEQHDRDVSPSNERLARGTSQSTDALLTPISLHLCRHTFASLMIDSGANPKAIQEFIGLSKIQTTFDVYGHLLPGSRDEVRERMDAYLTRNSDS